MSLRFRFDAMMLLILQLLLCTLSTSVTHSFIHPTTTSFRPLKESVHAKRYFSPTTQQQTRLFLVDETTTTDDSTTPIQRKTPYNVTNDIGILAPTGFWDPLNLAENIDMETYTQYRTAEIKHGRVAMLCVIGYIVPEIYKFPFNIAPGLSFQSIPNGVAAIDAIPSLGWMQIIFLIGAVDYYGYLGSYTFGQAPALSPDVLLQRQQSELSHGRLAMLASMELLRHDAQNYVIPNFDGLGNHLITGLPFIYS